MTCLRDQPPDNKGLALSDALTERSLGSAVSITDNSFSLSSFIGVLAVRSRQTDDAILLRRRSGWCLLPGKRGQVPFSLLAQTGNLDESRHGCDQEKVARSS